MASGRRVLIPLLVAGITATGAAGGTFAAFGAENTNDANAFSAGTVAISDNDGGGSMVSLSNAEPGDSSTGCIRVTYSGTLDAKVQMYATVSGPLAQYLTVTVTRGTGGSAFPSCTGFVADSTNYIGQGRGVMFSGPLSSYPATYAGGLVDPTSGSEETWTTSEARTYRFVISLVNDDAAQNLSASATFRWEARNS